MGALVWCGALWCASAYNPRVFLLARTTLGLAACVTVSSLIVGVPLAMLLVRTDLPCRRLLLLVCGLQLLLPLYVQAAAWQAGLGLQGLFALAGFQPLLVDGWWAVIWIHTLAAIPQVVLIVGVAVRLVEPELEEHALLDASPARVFFSVTLRRARGALAAAALWVAISTCGEMTVTNLYQVRTLSEELYTQFALGDEPGVVSASGITGTLLGAMLLGAAMVLVTRLAPHERHASDRAPLVYRLGQFKWPLLALVALLFCLQIGVPLVSLVGKAGLVVTRADDAWQRTWHVDKCLQQIASSPWRFRREFGWSLLIAALAALGAVAAGGLLAWWAWRGGVRGGLTWIVVAFCLAIPGPLVGIGLIWLLNRPDWPTLLFLYDRSITAPLLAQWCRVLPIATLVLRHVFATVPGVLVERATVDGVSRMEMLRHVVMAGRWPGLGLAWLLAFSVALGELAASILVVPPGVTTLPIRVFGLIHYGVDEQVAGICLSLVAISSLTGLGVLQLLRRQMRE